MPKYRDYFRQMMEENKEMFEDFAAIHAKYMLDDEKWQEEFNRLGEPIVETMREWEGRLCGTTEKGNNAKYSSRLADKFWEEIKAFFPKIDFVGIEVVQTAVREVQMENEVEEQTEIDKDLREIDEMDDSFEIRKLF